MMNYRKTILAKMFVPTGHIWPRDHKLTMGWVHAEFRGSNPFLIVPNGTAGLESLYQRLALRRLLLSNARYRERAIQPLPLIFETADCLFPKPAQNLYVGSLPIVPQIAGGRAVQLPQVQPMHRYTANSIK